MLLFVLYDYQSTFVRLQFDPCSHDMLSYTLPLLKNLTLSFHYSFSWLLLHVLNSTLLEYLVKIIIDFLYPLHAVRILLWILYLSLHWFLLTFWKFLTFFPQIQPIFLHGFTDFQAIWLAFILSFFLRRFDYSHTSEQFFARETDWPPSGLHLLNWYHYSTSLTLECQG